MSRLLALRPVPVLLTVIGLVAACGTAPGSSPSAAVAPSPPTSAVASPITDGWLRLGWGAVAPIPAVRPHGGFEHVFLASGRGAMIMIRNLEGAPTTQVSTTPDGAAWAVTESPSATIPFGYAVDGADDWLQVVARADGEPGLELVASADGLAWETRGRLPGSMRSAGESAVNGASMLVCGFGNGALELQNVCALSRDSGMTWEPTGDLDALLGSAAVEGLATMGEGFLALVAGEREAESIVLTSSDGSSWTRQPDLLASGGNEVIEFGSAVYATGLDGVVWTTRDGVEWHRVALPSTRSTWLSFVIAGDALVAVGIVVEPEGSAHMTDVLVSADGATWRADVIPALLVDRPDPQIMPVIGGLLAVGDPVMIVGRAIPADDPGPR